MGCGSSKATSTSPQKATGTSQHDASASDDATSVTSKTVQYDPSPAKSVDALAVSESINQKIRYEGNVDSDSKHVDNVLNGAIVDPPCQELVEHVFVKPHGEGNESNAGGSSIVILHFNDVYNIEPRDKEPVGGASRFTTQLRNVGGRDALILFSGDAFNPSMMSTVLKGKQMVPCLNEMNIHTAVLGNHGNHAPTRLISSSHAPFGPSAAVSRTELVLRWHRAAIHAFCLMLSLVGRFRLRARNAGGADALV